MKILLINVDSRFNIAIRRMYTYHLERNDDVQMIDLGFSGYPNKRKPKIIDASEYDLVCISNIFDINREKVIIKNCDNIIHGGIGSNHPEKKLMSEVEQCNPFYYEHEDVSYGFITRGCIRNCWFCKVPKFEGRMQTYNTVEKIVYSNPNMQRVSFMDNNILAYEDHEDVFQFLIDRNIKCDFNQGLDFRLTNERNLKLLSQLNYFGNYIFAFDDPKYEPILNKKIKLMKEFMPSAWNFKFYIYYHPSMDLNLAFRRVEWCREHECLPYLMRDVACWECEDRDFLIDYASYCNQPAFFKKMTFEEFLFKRLTNQDRIRKEITKYNSIIEAGAGDGLNAWDLKTPRREDFTK